MAPIQTKLVEPSLLTPSDRAWLNSYHAKVWVSVCVDVGVYVCVCIYVDVGGFGCLCGCVGVFFGGGVVWYQHATNPNTQTCIYIFTSHIKHTQK